MLLGPIGPGRAEDELRLSISAADSGPAQLGRLLARLDDEGIGGSLELISETDAPIEVEPVAALGAALEAYAPLAVAWEELVASLPDDWSDLLCTLELRSTDDLPPAALAIAPLNPSRHGPDPVFRFRVARRYGYGAAPEMAQRCLARLDEHDDPRPPPARRGAVGHAPGGHAGPDVHRRQPSCVMLAAMCDASPPDSS